MTDFELKTTSDNYEQPSASRVDSLGDYDDLSEEEIKDVLEFRSNPKNLTRFNSADELIADLNN